MNESFSRLSRDDAGKRANKRQEQIYANLERILPRVPEHRALTPDPRTYKGVIDKNHQYVLERFPHILLGNWINFAPHLYDEYNAPSHGKVTRYYRRLSAERKDAFRNTFRRTFHEENPRGVRWTYVDPEWIDSREDDYFDRYIEQGFRLYPENTDNMYSHTNG